MKVEEQHVGCRCIVKYDDVGPTNGMIVGSNSNGRDWEVYIFADRCVDTSVGEDQIIAIENQVTAIRD